MKQLRLIYVDTFKLPVSVAYGVDVILEPPARIELEVETRTGWRYFMDKTDFLVVAVRLPNGGRFIDRSLVDGLIYKGMEFKLNDQFDVSEVADFEELKRQIIADEAEQKQMDIDDQEDME